MFSLLGIYIYSFSACFSVSQLQQTLSSVQELLIQQQQKIQELSQELSTAKVGLQSLILL